MFYRLKTAFMKGIIAKKQKRGFDYEAAENYTLPDDADDDINNSYYFSAHDEAAGKSLFVRLGLRANHGEVWFYYSDGERRLVTSEMIYSADAPLSVKKTDNGWSVVFDGALSNGDGEVRAKFDGEFTSRERAIDFFSDMPPVRTAKAMAFEKWNKKFFADVQSNNQVHYEQFGVLRGTLEADGEKIQIDMPCVRDHSFGKRDWDYMNNHLWLAAVSESEQLNFSMVSYPAMTMLEVGNFKADGKPMAFVKRAVYDRAAISCGVIPERFSVKLFLTDGSVLDVNTVLRDSVKYVFKDGRYTLVEGVASFDINGKPFRGIFEIGLNGNAERRFNGIDIGKLKE